MTRWLSMALAISMAGSRCFAAGVAAPPRSSRASEFRVSAARHFSRFQAKPRAEGLRELKNAVFSQSPDAGRKEAFRSADAGGPLLDASGARESAESRLAAEAVLRLLAVPALDAAGETPGAALARVLEPELLDKIASAAAELEKAQPQELENLRRQLWGESSGDSDPSLFKKRLASHLQSLGYWEAHQVEILAQAQMLKQSVEEYARGLETSLGEEEFKKELDKSGVFVEHPRLGKAEITRVDGNRVVRAAHAPTQLSILFLDESVSRDSRHLRQFLSRQFFDAGSGRKDGKRGRNSIMVWSRMGQAAEALFYEKPRPSQGAWWKHYWHATYKSPARSDFLFGGILGTLQGVLAWGLSGLKLWLWGAPLVLAPILFTAGFGFFVGTFISTYRNWTYRGHWAIRAIKLAGIGVIFSYLLIAFMSGWGALRSPGEHLRIGSNVGVNIPGKAAWAEIARIGEKHNQFREPLPFNIKRSAVVHQFFYHINWIFRIAHLMGLPGGLALFIAGVPFGLWLSYLYAKKKGYPEAEEIRQRPKILARRFRDGMRRLVRPVKIAV